MPGSPERHANTRSGYSYHDNRPSSLLPFLHPLSLSAFATSPPPAATRVPAPAMPRRRRVVVREDREMPPIPLQR